MLHTESKLIGIQFNLMNKQIEGEPITSDLVSVA